MSSNVTSPRTVYNVLWSSRAFGGAEVYVETMRKRWGTQTIAMQGLGPLGLLRLSARIAFGRDVFILHDLRAALLGFLRPTRRNITVIHAPGKSPKLTRAISFLHAYIQKKVVMVAADLYEDPPNNRVVVVENFSSAGIEVTDETADGIWFGRMAETKCVLDLAAFWAEHMPTRTLHMVGDGPLLPELRARHEHDGSNIVFYGAQNRDQIRELASKCRYFMSFSGLEGLSFSLLESMDGGLLPIAKPLPSQVFLSEIEGLPIVSDDYATLAAELERINALPPDARAKMRDAVKASVHERFRDRWYGFWDATLADTQPR